MNKNSLLLLSSVILFLLGIYMIYLGTRADILPPTITGVGFLVIAIAFTGLRQK